MIPCNNGKCSDVYQPALNAVSSLHAQEDSSYGWEGEDRTWKYLQSLLTLLESKSCPAFLLYTQVPGAQPGRPGLCPQPSFRPPSKLLFYTVWPGTPTVTKLRPHYGTV